MENLRFEEAMKKLEKIAEELEDGTVTLDESFEKFKEGMNLSKYCSKKLDEIEKKISILVKQNGENYQEEPFDTGVGGKE
jgi:exodeoxyribonuclease VII small subunit